MKKNRKIALKKRMQMAKESRVTSPDAAEIKLKKLAAMTLAEFFRYNEKQYGKYLRHNVNLLGTYKDACIFLNRQFIEGYARYMSEDFPRSFMWCDYLTNPIDAVTDIAVVLSEAMITPDISRLYEHPLFFLMRMTLKDYIDAVNTLLGGCVNSDIQRIGNYSEIDSDTPLAEAVRTLGINCDKCVELLNEYYGALADGGRERLKAATDAIRDYGEILENYDLEISKRVQNIYEDTDGAITALQERCLTMAGRLCGFIIEPFIHIQAADASPMSRFKISAAENPDDDLPF